MELISVALFIVMYCCIPAGITGEIALQGYMLYRDSSKCFIDSSGTATTTSVMNNWADVCTALNVSDAGSGAYTLTVADDSSRSLQLPTVHESSLLLSSSPTDLKFYDINGDGAMITDLSFLLNGNSPVLVTIGSESGTLGSQCLSGDLQFLNTGDINTCTDETWFFVVKECEAPFVSSRDQLYCIACDEELEYCTECDDVNVCTECTNEATLNGDTQQCEVSTDSPDTTTSASDVNTPFNITKLLYIVVLRAMLHKLYFC